jgi:polysaccharide biosynthesis/export protein
MALVRLISVGVLSTAWCCSALAAEPVSAAPASTAGALAPEAASPQPASPPASQATAPTPTNQASPAAGGAETGAGAPPPAGAIPAGASTVTQAAPVPGRSPDFAWSQNYVLQPGDDLQISVWKETDLTAEVFIRPDGGISFPLAGDLPAAGLTVAALTAALEKRVRRYEPEAVVTVMVKAAIGNRVYVIGKVNKPGDFALNRPIDVMQALSLAGGATPYANTNHIKVLRREGTRIRAIAFRYGDVQRGRKLDQNILLQSGDTVVVP